MRNQRFHNIISRRQGIILDVDAANFLAAAAINDPVIIRAVNTLVLDYKDALLWNGALAIYPIVGGQASSHRFNLKNPADSNAAFRLEFFGGWTHDANGMTSNGSNAYANTFLNPAASLSNYNAHSSIYCRQVGGNAGFDLGATTSPGFLNEFLLASRRTSLAISGLYDFFNNAFGFVSVSGVSDARGFTSNSVVNNTDQRLFKNGAQVGATNTSTNASTPANFPIYIGAVNQNSTSVVEYCANQYAFASIGNGLSAAQMATLYTIIQKFQTALGRNV